MGEEFKDFEMEGPSLTLAKRRSSGTDTGRAADGK